MAELQDMQQMLKDDIVNNEKDIVSFCEALTNHTAVDVEDAKKHINNIIDNMNVDDVFDALDDRGITLSRS